MLSRGRAKATAVPDAPVDGWLNSNCVAFLQTNPIPVSEMVRKELAGTKTRDVNVTLSKLSVRTTSVWPSSSTIPLSLPEDVAAMVLPSRSIMAPEMLVDSGCTRLGVEHGPN